MNAGGGILFAHKKTPGLQGFSLLPFGGGTEGAGARTQDLRLKRPLLYQLSYSSGEGETLYETKGACHEGKRKKWWRVASASGE